MTPAPAPAVRSCPACHAQVVGATMFCTQCGHDLRVAAAPQSMASSAFCTNCGKQNDPGVRFCGGCGSQVQVGAVPQTGYTQSGQYSQYTAQSTTQSPYQDTPYPSQASYPQQPAYQHSQQSQYPQPGYQQPQQPGYQQPQYPQPQFPQPRHMQGRAAISQSQWWGNPLWFCVVLPVWRWLQWEHPIVSVVIPALPG